MPGNVQLAVATAVMPFSLCARYARSQQFLCAENGYQNGESQRRLQAATPRRTWRLAKRLTSAQLVELRTFYDAHQADAFVFYDLWETVPKFHWDATGAAQDGRYKVKFACPWEQSTGPARSEVELDLVEVA